MTWKKKVVIYTVYLTIIYSITIGFLFLELEIADSHPFIILFILFSTINLLFGQIILRMHLLFAVVATITVTTTALYTAILSSNYSLFSSDPYGVYTAIIVNGLISVILWEVVCQLYQKVFIKSKANR